MVKDLDGPKEAPEKVAERKWRNNALRQKYKDKQMPVVAIVDPADIDYVNRKVHLPKDAPPEIASVVENKNKRLVGGFERKFIKEIREIMSERPNRNREIELAILRQWRRKLMIEKLRRMELKYGPLDKDSEVSSAQSDGEKS